MMTSTLLQRLAACRFRVPLLLITAIVPLATAFQATGSQAKEAEDSKPAGLSIETSGPYTMTAPVSMRLALRNTSATAMTLPSLDAGFVYITLKQKPAGSSWSATHGGPVQAIQKRLSQGEL